MLKLNTPVCVATEDFYSENNGAYTIFWMFDGEHVFTVGGMYSTLAYNHYTIDATNDQIIEASLIHLQQLPETRAYNKYAIFHKGANTYIGCIVTLARSRKTPNKKPLLVINFVDRYFNNSYNVWVNEKIDLLDTETGTRFNDVSVTCIKDLVKGVKHAPFWHKYS